MWVCVGMATKNISITENAYKILAMRKGENESFSKVIIREMGKKGNTKNLMEFFGVLSKKSAEAIEKSIEESRKIHREMHKKRVERLQREFES